MLRRGVDIQPNVECIPVVRPSLWRKVWCVIRSNVRLPIVSHRASVLVQRYVSATICRLCMTVIIWCLWICAYVMSAFCMCMYLNMYIHVCLHVCIHVGPPCMHACMHVWIRRHIPLSTAKTISNALISSRLDYCNSLLNNIAKQDLSKWQHVQNCLARVVLRAPRFSSSLPLLKQLHWLPVNHRIKSKLSTLTYRALAIHQPPYLATLLHFSNIPRQLRSSTSQQL